MWQSTISIDKNFLVIVTLRPVPQSTNITVLTNRHSFNENNIVYAQFLILVILIRDCLGSIYAKPSYHMTSLLFSG